MAKPENPVEPFKKALAEATRVIADDPDLSVSFSVDPPGMTTDSVRLPQISRRMTRDEVMIARGTADALLMANADTDIRYGENELSPLDSAASHGHVSVLRALIQHGVDVNAVDSTGYTALHMAGVLENVFMWLAGGTLCV